MMKICISCCCHLFVAFSVAFFFCHVFVWCRCKLDVIIAHRRCCQMCTQLTSERSTASFQRQYQQELSSCGDGRPFGHSRHGPKNEGAAVHLSVGVTWSPSNTMSPGAETYLCTKWHLDPSNRVATIYQRYRRTGQDNGPVKTGHSRRRLKGPSLCETNVVVLNIYMVRT